MTGSAEATEALAARLGAACVGGELVLLTGDLGAGKTCFVRGLARGLGGDPTAVRSPSFTLLHQYAGRCRLDHFDVYFTPSVEDLHRSGLREALAAGAVVAIEWGERFARELPAERLEIELLHVDAEHRRIGLRPRGEGALALLGRAGLVNRGGRRPFDGEDRETMPADDRELMLLARSGSRDAFAELVARHEGRLVSFFYRQCGDRQLAEDCAQEVFVRLFRARDRYTPDASFNTFLFTIARNYWIDVARARRVRPDLRPLDRGASRAPEASEEDRLNVLPSAAAPPPVQAALADDLARLHRALERLPETLRDVVQLGVIEALPYAEVAQILAIPVGTVKSRVHAAVQMLRTLLGGGRE